MKTRLIFLVLLIACFACGTNNKPVPDAEKEKMISEVKQVINDINKALEDVNFDAANEPCLDSPDFSYTSNGITMNYAEFMGFKTDFDKRLNQKFNLISEKYVVLDKATILSTSNCKWLINYKDGHSLSLDPWVVQATFKRIDNKWRVINLVECGVEQSVRNTENETTVANQLSQIWKEYGEAIKNRDIDKVMSYHTVDFINYPSYGSTQDGFDAYKNFIARFIENNSFEDFNVEQIEVIVEGDFAFEVATMKQKFASEAGEPVETTQRSFSIFKKQSDGSWKFYRWIGQQ